MSFFKGILAGLAIGYLTAPRSGKETREKLTGNINDLQDQWNEGVAQVKSQVDKLTGQAQDKVEEFKDKAERTVDKAERSVNDQRVKNEYNNKVDNTADAVKSGVNNLESAFKID